MGTADPLPAITHGHHNIQIRPGQFQPGGIGQGTAVQPVKGMGIKKGVKKSRAADITDHNDLISSQTHILKGFVQRVRNPVVGTSRAKHRWSLRIEQTIH